MSRNRMTTFEGVTVMFGWDNPTQSFFADVETDEEDPCQACLIGEAGEQCPDMCAGHTWDNIVCVIGPMTGNLTSNELVFKSVLFDLGFENEEQLDWMIEKLVREREMRKTVRPQTGLQLRVAQMFSEFTKEIK